MGIKNAGNGIRSHNIGRDEYLAFTFIRFLLLLYLPARLGEILERGNAGTDEEISISMLFRVCG
jgi:hypothetical protein